MVTQSTGLPTSRQWSQTMEWTVETVDSEAKQFKQKAAKNFGKNPL